MVGRNAIHPPDVDLFIQQPFHHVAVGAGVEVDVFLLVGRLPELGVAVPAGVQEQDVAFVHFHPVFDHFGGVEIQFPDFIAEVDHHAGAVEPFDGKLVHRHPPGDEVARGVQMRSHVVGSHNILGVHAVLGFAFYIFHLKRRVVRPEWGVLIQGLGKIVELHAASG